MKNLIVIGGGAAGFFCAVNVARLNPHVKVTILEKSNKLLSKVKISGGGRCNVTNACFDIVELSKKYPRGERFLKKAFHLLILVMKYIIILKLNLIILISIIKMISFPFFVVFTAQKGNSLLMMKKIIIIKTLQCNEKKRKRESEREKRVCHCPN